MRKFLHPLRIALLVHHHPRIQLRILFLKFSEFFEHFVSFTFKRLSKVLFSISFRTSFLNLLFDLFCVLHDVINKVLPWLEPLAWKSPKESTGSYLVCFNKVVINQTLVHIFDSLQYYTNHFVWIILTNTLLCPILLNLFQVEDLFLFFMH